MFAALISLIIIVIAVYILAVITDHFFVPSLDAVAKRLDMPSDVAGASLMAVGSSAPELFIALTAVFRGGAHGQVGIGTIVGSAVFNILVITGVSALVAKELKIGKGSVERDIIFYLGSVGLLLYVFWNGEIVLWEAVVMVAAYILYLYVLWRWGENNPEERREPTQPTKPEEASPGFLGTVNNIIRQVFGIVARDPQKQYVWAMLISIVAIAGISWILVEAAVVLSTAIGLPPVIVSMTLLAAGTSAPDLIASVDVAREGRGAMAVANAVGSDIFDVLIGLGVPWLIVLAFLGESMVHVDTDGLIISIFLLVGTVVLLYVFLFTERRLSKWEGWALLIAYGVYVTYAFFATAPA